jgi:hypothetical protein
VEPTIKCDHECNDILMRNVEKMFQSPKVSDLQTIMNVSELLHVKLVTVIYVEKLF